MYRMLIDGKLVAADRTYPSVNPATGQVLSQAPDASVADAQAAIAAAPRFRHDDLVHGRRVPGPVPRIQSCPGVSTPPSWMAVRQEGGHRCKAPG